MTGISTLQWRDIWIPSALILSVAFTTISSQGSWNFTDGSLNTVGPTRVRPGPIVSLIPGPVNLSASQLLRNPMTLVFERAKNISPPFHLSIHSTVEETKETLILKSHECNVTLQNGIVYTYIIAGNSPAIGHPSRIGSFRTLRQKDWKGTCDYKKVNECKERVLCIEQVCHCNRGSVQYWNPRESKCSNVYYRNFRVSCGSNSFLSGRPLWTQGQPLEISCSGSIQTHPTPSFKITWLLNDRRIDPLQDGDLFMVDPILPSNIFISRRSTFPPDYHPFSSLLQIKNFSASLTGKYSCLLEWPDDVDTLVGFYLAESDPPPRPPMVYITPSRLLVRPNSLVNVTCHGRNTDILELAIDNKLSAYSNSGDVFLLYSFVAYPNITHVSCTAWGYKGYKPAVVIVLVEFFTEANKTCPGDRDRYGIFWERTPAPLLTSAVCPLDYTGLAVRQCTSDGIWEEPSYVNCTRIGLAEVIEMVQILYRIQPSKESIEGVSQAFASCCAGGDFVVMEDIPKIVDVMANISLIVAEDQSDELLVTTTSLLNFFDVADNVLSIHDSIWKDLEESESGLSDSSDLIGAKLLVSMDNLTICSLEDPFFDRRLYVTNNVVVKRDILTSPRDISFPWNTSSLNETEFEDTDQWTTESLNSVFLPFSALPEHTGNFRYSVLLYKANAKRLTVRDTENTEIRSDILAFSLSENVRHLTQGLQMTFQVQLSNKDSEPLCGYLDTSADVLGTWSTEGCHTKILKSGKVNCTCNHMTNFAVLMSTSRSSSSDRKALSIISIIGCVISIVCLLALIITYMVLWRYIKKDRKIYLHLCLSVCLLLVYVIFLAGVDNTSHDPECTVVTALLHYLLLVVFSLMLCEGVELLLATLFVFKFNFSKWILLLPAFGVPLLVVAITLAATEGKDYHRDDDICWLSVSSGTIWAFVAPAFVIIVANFFVLIITVYVLMNTVSVKGKDNVDKAKLALKSCAVLSPILGLTWLFGILAIDGDTVVFQYLFAICNTLQGVAIFIFHCLLLHQVREAFKIFQKKWKNKSTTFASFSSSSQKSSRDPPRKSRINTNSTSLSQESAPSSPTPDVADGPRKSSDVPPMFLNESFSKELTFDNCFNTVDFKENGAKERRPKTANGKDL